MGAVLACQNYLLGFQEDREVATRWWNKTGRWAALLGFTIVTTCVIAAHFSATELIAEALFLSGISLLSYGCIAYALTHPKSKLLSGFRNPVMIFFGDISYCFYITHLYIIRLYDHWCGSLQPGDVAALILRAVVVIAITVLVCLFSRYMIERPAQSLRRYVLR
jgi:peptidoglycan/LPS O-acetylase OafA/YrhL